MISSGTSRNDGSNAAADADRVLAEVDHLGEQRLVGRAPAARSRVSSRASSARTRSRRASGSTTTCAARSASTYASGARDLDRPVRQEAMAAAVAAARSGRPTTAGRPRRRTARRATAPGARTSVSLQPQRIDFGHGIAARARRAARAGAARLGADDVALRDDVEALLAGDFLLRRATPARRRSSRRSPARPWSACRRRANAAPTGGPTTSSLRSGCRSASPFTITASRRGVPSARTLACVRRAAVELAPRRAPADRRARFASIFAGNLLAADLEQQISRHGGAPRRAARRRARRRAHRR